MVDILAKGFNYLFAKKNKSTFAVPSLIYLDRSRKIEHNYFDYIRLSTLELLCFEINDRNIEGSIAEVGVYKGKFARYMNDYLPNRKFFLFDTFNGFHKSDVATELDHSFSKGNQDFSKTSIDEVLGNMPHKEMCIIKQGYFPETAIGVEDSFCLVSLDADLYEPIYNGLKFFYPKLVKGGFIMIHDFNNSDYKGAREAVMQFCDEFKIGFVPIPDKAGTAIISK